MYSKIKALTTQDFYDMTNNQTKISMKSKHKFFRLHMGLLFIIMAGSLLTFSSCEKEEEYGIPQITNIRVTDPGRADESLSVGELGQMIVIQGKNLRSAQHVFFNNVEAFFNPTLATDENLIVRIPNEFPTEITNAIKVVTKGGEASYNFVVDIPAPQAIDFPLEWVPEGEALTIRGDYFVNVNSVEFHGGATTTNFNIVTPQKLEVMVPAGAQSGPVKVHAVAGTATSRAHFRDNRNMMVDFSGAFPICWGGDAYVVNANNIPANVPVKPINGNFYYIKKDYAGGTWWIQETVIAYCGGLTVSGSKANWALAFEMWVGEAWDKNWFEIEMFGDAMIYYEWRGWDSLGGEAKVLRNTGWMTVKIPLANMTALSGDTFRMGRFGSYKAQHADVIEFAFDNFRFVPLN